MKSEVICFKEAIYEVYIDYFYKKSLGSITCDFMSQKLYMNCYKLPQFLLRCAVLSSMLLVLLNLQLKLYFCSNEHVRKYMYCT